MKRLKKSIILLTIISLGAFFFSPTNQISIEASSDDNNSINYVHLKNTSTNLSIIYSTSYQNKIYNQIAKLKKYKNYTIEHPLLITNPYGTNTTSVYMYFKTSLIISSRETSTIIKLDNIYSNPSIDYMIGSDHFWKENVYDSLPLNKTSDFSMRAGQHCVTYVEDNSLHQEQYYLYLYNNNLAVSTTQSDYDWKNDSNYSNTYYSLKKGTSYYYKYLVDENTRPVELVSSIPVAYSGYVSSVQELDGNVIIDSGSQRLGVNTVRMELYYKHLKRQVVNSFTVSLNTII